MSSVEAMDVAILGGGQMGVNVMEHLRDSPLVRDITVFDPNPQRLEELRRSHAVKTSHSLAQVLDDTAIRLVFITAANHAHKDLAVQALEAGKAVMCEKADGHQPG